MMKKTLLVLLLLTLNIQAYTHERKAHTKADFKQMVFTCANGYKNYILKKNHIFYASTQEKFLSAKKAKKASCRDEKIYTKKDAIICTKKSDMYTILTQHITNPKTISHYSSCFRVTRKLLLDVKKHYPITASLAYYEVTHKNKRFFIPSYSIMHTRLHKKRTLHNKHIHKIKNIKHHKKHKIIQQKRKHKFTKLKSMNKNKINHTKSLNHSVNIETPPSINNEINTTIHNPTIPEPTKVTNIKAKIKPITIKNEAQIQPILKDKTTELFSYRCVGTYGGIHNISMINNHSMSEASDTLWKKCQAVKGPNEVCKIVDCYKLIR